MIFGIQDVVIFAVVFIVNFFIWGKQVKGNLGCLIGVIIFGITLPLISQLCEIYRVTGSTEDYDNTTMIYTYFRYPIYWLAGTIQIMIISRRDRG